MLETRKKNFIDQIIRNSSFLSILSSWIRF